MDAARRSPGGDCQLSPMRPSGALRSLCRWDGLGGYLACVGLTRFLHSLTALCHAQTSRGLHEEL